MYPSRLLQVAEGLLVSDSDLDKLSLRIYVLLSFPLFLAYSVCTITKVLGGGYAIMDNTALFQQPIENPEYPINYVIVSMWDSRT